jgi:alpha-tubulin suppressor-like RCC1 family protein
MMKLKITCFIVLFLMVSVNLLNTDNVSFAQSLEDEETPKEVILSLNSTNSPGFQEGSIFTDTTLSSGSAHTCAILDDGSVSCWGYNSDGQLGDGTTTQRNTPTQTSSLGTGRTAVAISSGAFHTCAILDDGTVSCWGRNLYGGLGNGTTTDRNTPTQTSSLGTGRTAVAISSAAEHTCAILDDASVSCWGYNGYGQIGDGTYTDRNTPTQTSSLGTGRTAVAISSGAVHTCVILDDGTVSCWGDNRRGQLGDGTNIDRSTPTQTSSLGTGITAVAVSSGFFHTCAILDDGSVNCWGRNFEGQLGDGTTTNRSTPTHTSSLGTGRTAVAISSKGFHTCALLDDGTVSCWGLNNYGQLGDRTTTDRNTPTQTLSFETGRTAVAISSGEWHTCAILDDASVSCWGYNGYGQLGDGTTTDRSTPNQTSSLGTTTNPRTVALSERDFDGDGILNIFDVHHNSPYSEITISSGMRHACAILDDASVSCWGVNSDGRLGDGTTTQRNTPTQTTSLGTGRTAVAISSGRLHTCIILDDGDVSCWGNNSVGQLGDGTTTQRNTSTQTLSLGSGRTAVAISSGGEATCAILDDGSVSCWGDNQYGQLGDGTNTDRSAPSQTSSLGTGRTAVSISSGGSRTCAILDDGSVSCWGRNLYGGLGDGTNTNRNTPTQTSSLGTGRTAVAISAGASHTCAILDDDSVSCWGDNWYGQLGDGTNTERNRPTQTSSLGTGRTAVAISPGFGHTCAVLDDGSVSCWGYNYYGQLADGTTTDQNTPTQTMSLGTNRTAVTISSGLHYSCAILDNASVSCWGANGDGRLGDGTNADRGTPAQTSSLGKNQTALLVDGDTDSDGTLDYLDDFPNNSIRSIACTSGQYGRYLCVDSPAGKYVPSSSAMYATDCASGTYQALTGQTSCVDADAGYYVATTSQISQTACAIGTYQANTGQSSCDDADAGYYVATTKQTSQIPCAIGTYQALTGQASCDDADAGYYVSFTAQSNQIPCAIGTYQALTGQASCVDADAGHYVGQSGQFSQIECLAGTYQPNIGQYSCINASIGFYVLLDGAVKQTACPYQTSTPEIGSKLESDCVSDSDDDGTIDVDDAFPLDPSEDKDSDGDGRGDNIQEIDEAKQMRMILIAAAILFVTISVIGALVMMSRKEDAESDWHQEDSLFD